MLKKGDQKMVFIIYDLYNKLADPANFVPPYFSFADIF